MDPLVLSWGHESPYTRTHPSRGNTAAPAGPGQGNPGRRDRVEDRGAPAATGGAATGVDRGGPGPDAHEPEPLDPWCEPPGYPESRAPAPTRPAIAPDPRGPGDPGVPPGPIPPSLRLAPGPMGRPDARHAPEAALWYCPEGPASPTLVAPVGLPAEADGLHVPAGAHGGRPPLPAPAKKNSRRSGPATPSSSRMRRALRCTRAWDACGGRAASGCGCRRRASTGPASICRGGWRRSWAGPGWSEPHAAIARGSCACSATSLGSSGDTRFGAMSMARAGIEVRPWMRSSAPTADCGSSTFRATSRP